VYNPDPRIVVLGGPIPGQLVAELDGTVTLVEESAIGADGVAGVLVHARADSLPAVRRFRVAGGQLPIYGLAEGTVSVADRILWIREGADDLLPMASAAEVLVRRIRGEATRIQPADEAVPLGVRLDRWLVALHRYVQLRTRVLNRLGPDGATLLLDMSFHRDQVMRAADAEVTVDALGQRRGGARETLAWTVRVLGEPSGEAELVNVGADGYSVASAEQLPLGALRVEIDGLTVSAVLQGEVRWCREAGPDRWEAGVYVQATTLMGTG